MVVNDDEHHDMDAPNLDIEGEPPGPLHLMDPNRLFLKNTMRPGVLVHRLPNVHISCICRSLVSGSGGASAAQVPEQLVVTVTTMFRPGLSPPRRPSRLSRLPGAARNPAAA